MLKRYFCNYKRRNFSIASIWIKGGSDMDSIGKKGINKILCFLLTRGCEGFDNFVLSEYIESYGAELTKEVFEEYIRSKAETAYHPSCTLKMGEDNMAVVDQKLKVHGVENLRVVDASVMPEITSGNLNAPTLMIAERASEFILN